MFVFGEKGGGGSPGTGEQPLPGLGFTALLLPSLSFKNKLTAADSSLILLGCKCSKRKGSGYFLDEVIKQWEGLHVQLRGSGGPDGSRAQEVKAFPEA